MIDFIFHSFPCKIYNFYAFTDCIRHKRKILNLNLNLKNRAPWKDWVKKDRDKFCLKVNSAALVYDKWNVIVDNLTDPRMTEIDARNFSMEMYYEARDITWCLNYNEQLRMRKSNSEK